MPTPFQPVSVRTRYQGTSSGRLAIQMRRYWREGDVGPEGGEGEEVLAERVDVVRVDGAPERLDPDAAAVRISAAMAATRLPANQ